MPLAQVLEHLNRLANDSLHLWDLPEGATARLINVSENATYLIEGPADFRAILRIHRENYHTRRAIECELAWIAALDEARAVVTPGHYLGRNGQAIQVGQTPGLAAPRFMVLFHFLNGVRPDEAGDLVARFEELGGIAAQAHAHSIGWQRPADFQRLTWDVDAVFGAAPTWGNWRDGPGVDGRVLPVLERLEATVRRRLSEFGQRPERYGLIHADMRLTNLLADTNGTRLIDFDDCGMGWFMYDFAAAISFMEDDPRVPELKRAWLRGYRKVRPLSALDEAEIDTFVMLRRMALLAWIGSHIEAPEPQALAPGFAATTARLAAAYLQRMGTGAPVEAI